MPSTVRSEEWSRRIRIPPSKGVKWPLRQECRWARAASERTAKRIRIPSGVTAGTRVALSGVGREKCTTMKPASHTDMREGQDAFDRFRKAVKTIVAVPKSVVSADQKKKADKKKAAKA